MFVFNVARCAPGVRVAVASACASVLAHGAAFALPQDALPDLVVSATRSPQSLLSMPVGATVITADAIRRSGASDVNEAIRKLAGVVGRTDLSGGRELTLDLRGYGDAAWGNTAVLVDGMRVSENEQTSARLSAIPLDQIERIEIVRGGNAVLWGEGATAGVVNVILKRAAAARPSATLTGSLGSFSTRDVRVAVTQSWGAFSLDASGRALQSDGYRDNSRIEQDSGALGLAYSQGGFTQRVRVQRERQTAKLPGYLTFAQFEENPRAASPTSAGDFAGTAETRVTSHSEWRDGDLAWQLDLGERQRQARFNFYGRDVRHRQATPKLVYQARQDGLDVGGVAGMDYQSWRAMTPPAFGTGQANQRNTAGFLQGHVGLPTGTKLVAGYRQERIQKDDASPFAVPYALKRNLMAAELGVNQVLSQQWSGYGRLARSYRLGNVDDNSYTPPGQTPLQPQISHDHELGLRWTAPGLYGTLRVFRQNNVNEIMYAPSPISGMVYNVNADPTRKQGAEIESRWSATDNLDVAATWQRLSAKYRDGVYSGRQQVLVARDTATLRASYRVLGRHLIEAGVQHRGGMRFGDDYDNQCARRIPASTRLDARYAVEEGPWSLSVRVTNLADKKGYDYGYRCATGALYPEPGRAVSLTAAMTF